MVGRQRAYRGIRLTAFDPPSRPGCLRRRLAAASTRKHMPSSNPLVTATRRAWTKDRCRQSGHRCRPNTRIFITRSDAHCARRTMLSPRGRTATTRLRHQSISQARGQAGRGGHSAPVTAQIEKISAAPTTSRTIRTTSVHGRGPPQPTSPIQSKADAPLDAPRKRES